MKKSESAVSEQVAGEPPSPVQLPDRSPPLLRWFTGYAQGYIARHFHAVRQHGPAPAWPEADTPVVVYLNHPSWWDPLLCLLLRERYLPGRLSFAPIEAAMLARYRFFARLGFFGVDPGTPRGAGQFLRTARALLARPNSALWLTPQGRFCDVRERPVRFRPGLGHLAARLERAVFVPLAIEVTFWYERTPEALIRFGEPVAVSPQERLSPAAWTARLEMELERTQDTLAGAAIERRPEAFEVLLRGRAGVGGLYDFWRGTLARLRGERFRAEHHSP